MICKCFIWCCLRCFCNVFTIYHTHLTWFSSVTVISYFGCIRRTFFMTSEILLSAKKLSCTLTLPPTTLDWLLSLTILPTTLDWLLSVTEECGDFRVERDEGRTSAEGSGEEGTWPALAGRSLYRKHKTHRYS